MVLINRDDVIKMIMEDGIYCDTDEDKKYSAERILNLLSFTIVNEDYIKKNLNT